MDINIRYDAPPTVGRFMDSTAMFRVLAGPIGSGKTTGCVFDQFKHSCEQAPCIDGLRHTRFAIVRQTLKQLKDTVLKDIEEWLKGVCTYKVSDSTIFINFGDVRSEWLLIPLEDPEDQRRLLSMQLTGAWLSEAVEMSVDLVQPILGRCGRYPSMGMKPDHIAREQWPTWYGAIADTNFPTENDPWHLFMEDPPPDTQIFKQPSGRALNAENIYNLPGGRKYYSNLANGRSEAWIKRYIDAQYGPDPSGSAVHKDTFKKEFHVQYLSPASREQGRKYAVEPSAAYPLVVIQDFGRCPCALICQIDHKGRGLVLEEIVSMDMGLEMHITTQLLPALNKERYLGKKFYVIGDPAGTAKNTQFESSDFDLLKSHGLLAYPAPTNDPDRRIAAVDNLLLQQRDGGPALVIDGDQCPKLVMAMGGRYRYPKRKLEGQRAMRPDKLHPWSDVCDDLQYFCLCIQGGFHNYIANRLQRHVVSANVGPRHRVSARGWT